MRKKFLMMMIITILSFLPFANVYAEGELEPGTSSTVKDIIDKESTVYIGEIFVDGESQMRWLYSSDISNLRFAFGELAAKLYGTSYYDLVPELKESSDAVGLMSSSLYESSMDSNWTSAGYVANKYFSGTTGEEVNEDYSDETGISYILTPLFDKTETVDGVLNIHYEATKLNYTRVDVTTNSTYTVTFDANGGTPTTTQIVEGGSKVVIPTDPTRDGYDFMFWESDNGIDISDEITEDTTFVARWVKKFNIKRGSDQTFYSDSSDDITVVSDGPFDEFSGFVIYGDNDKIIYMDDLTEGTDYLLEEGSTKLTLKNSFLKALDPAKYYVGFYYYNQGSYEYGYADTTLLVKESSETSLNDATSSASEDSVSDSISKRRSKINNPQTGDNILLYVLSLGLCVIGFVVSGLYIKKI